MKTTKKIIMMFIATALLVGCIPDGKKKKVADKQDEKQQDAPKKQDTPKELTYVRYFIGDGADLLKLVDISVEYDDNKGQLQKETVTALPWEKVYSNMKRKLPVKMEMTVTYAKKASIPDQEKYTVAEECYIDYQATGSIQSEKSRSSMTIKKSKIDLYIDDLTEKARVETIDLK